MLVYLILFSAGMLQHLLDRAQRINNPETPETIHTECCRGLAGNIFGALKHTHSHSHTHRGRLARSVKECGHNGVTVAMETGGGLPHQDEPFPLLS